TSCLKNHGNLGTGLVRAIDNQVQIRCQDSADIVRRDEVVYEVQHAMRVDTPHPGGHCVYLGLPQRLGYRVQLPIDVGFGNMIQIDERQRPNSGTGQCLVAPRADTTYSCHRYMRAYEL